MSKEIDVRDTMYIYILPVYKQKTNDRHLPVLWHKYVCNTVLCTELKMCDLEKNICIRYIEYFQKFSIYR